MKVLTVINDEKNHYFNLLRLSCALNGLQLVALVSSDNMFYSRRIKDDLLKDYLLDEPNDEIILFTDGIDAVFTASEAEILSKFYQFNSDLVFSAELGCWPDKSLAEFYKSDDSSPFKYLNSGGFIGKIGLIKELIEDNSFDLGNFDNSNQYLWTKRYFKNINKIVIDRQCEIFCAFFKDLNEENSDLQNTSKSEEFKNYKLWFDQNFLIEKNRIFNKITKTWPCHAHFNGPSKILMDDSIIDMLYSTIPAYKKTEFYFEKIIIQN
jgi:hypothetical protein